MTQAAASADNMDGRFISATFHIPIRLKRRPTAHENP